MVDEDEFTERRTFIGECCPMCQGRGETGFIGFGPLGS